MIELKKAQVKFTNPFGVIAEEKATNKVSIEKLDRIAQYTKKPLAYFLPHTVVDSTTISG